MSSSNDPNESSSKCPFASLVGKLAGGSWWGSSSSATAGGGAATCPLGFGARSSANASVTGSKCPLGFGGGSSDGATAAIAPDTLPAMALAELQEAAAAEKGLVSVKGLVFAVSGRADDIAPLLGHDCSRFFAVGGGGGESGPGGAAASASSVTPVDLGVLDQGLEGLSYEEVVRLERVLEGFLRSFGPPVAVLAEGDRRTLFGGASMVAPGGLGGKEEEEDGDKGRRLHELIEQGAGAAAIGEVLGDGAKDSMIVNCPCTRTGLTPLHKAVESAVEGEDATLLEVVRLLVSKGADRTAPAALYDGDTPLKLARRLRRGPEMEALLQV